MKDQKKIGGIISYFNILLGMLGNFLLIPMMIAVFSDDEYSIYKVMQSFAGPLIMLNLGISTITARAVAKFRATDNGNQKDKENTLALALLIACSMAILAMILGMLMLRLLPRIYGSSYNFQMLKKAKWIFIVFVATTAIRIVNDAFNGCIIGNECFIWNYGENTVQHLLRFFAIFLLLNNDADTVAVALVDLLICLLLLIGNGIYTKVRLKERFRLHCIKREEIKGIAAFSAAILLQAIVNQINNNMDIVILGAVVVDKEVITMYSSALSIYAIYNGVLSVLVSLYFPKATQLVIQQRSGEELTDFVIGPGRVQAIIAVAILSAFALFGKNFITVWIGQKYQDAYYVALMLMVPVTIPLVQNICLSILDAQLKRLFRSVALVIMALINMIISVVLIQFIGFWGAALGTVISLLIGHIILMNIYYYRIIKLNVIRMLREIFAGILPAGIISGMLCIPLVMLENTLGMFLTKCTVFVAVYTAALWLGGLNKTEKNAIRKVIMK